LPLLFAITLFVSALLLFLVQPIIAKMVLPSLGGTPAVWVTCMVFFQAVLLAGYSYAHALTRWLSIRRQVLIHLALLVAPLFVFPLGMASGWVQPGEANPFLWLLALLSLSVGLPFFVLSTSAPLLQKWFAQTGHASARDPYFLYTASNLGSMLALLSYPFLIEPYLPLRALRWLSQSWLWTFGYGGLMVLLGSCAWVMWRRPQPADPAEQKQAPPESITVAKKDKGKSGGSPHETRFKKKDKQVRQPPPPEAADLERALTTSPWLTRLHWIALAFVPSSLMLGVTTYITMDIAAIPLLWLVPLSLYLLSFILVFARWPLLAHKITVLIMPLFLLLLIFLMMSQIKIKSMYLKSDIWLILLNLLVFFLVALVCHGELARRRPATSHLTEFYLLMSVGGVLGGLFNGLLAPLLFDRVIEYQLAMVCAALLLPRLDADTPGWIARRVGGSKGLLAFIDLGIACGVGIVTFIWMRFLTASPRSSLGSLASFQEWVEKKMDSLGESLHFNVLHFHAMWTYGLPVLLCFALVTRSLRFGLSVGALFVAYGLCVSLNEGEVLHRERSFFGVLAVKKSRDKVSLVNGTTLHGMQDLSRPLEPLTYYHRTGPIGNVFNAFKGKDAKKNLAFIGLGSGTLASYGDKGQTLTFYEIDKAVIRITCDLDYFTYYKDCVKRGADVRVVLGDARLRLEEAPDHSYDLIVVDAFSSDAIPVHLMTREAIELYFRKLATDGIVAVHISNRHLDLQPVLANLQQDLGLAGLTRYDDTEDDYPGKSNSDWVILALHSKAFGSLNADTEWTPLRTNPDVGVWTDDFSNLLSVWKWKIK
jgi:hypothetical protein